MFKKEISTQFALSTIYRLYKDVGDLGIRDLKTMNKAFLAKLAWRFFD